MIFRYRELTNRISQVHLALNIMKEGFQYREPLHNLHSEMSLFTTIKVRVRYHGRHSATKS